MKPERWKQIDDLLEAALDRPLAERTSFLDRVCAGDEELRREVESLLGSDEQAGGFIESPPSEVAADLLGRAHDDSIPDQRIAHYEILSPLGAGGMGEVYLAHDLRLRRKVALKLLPASFSEDAKRVRRFEQEARAAAQLAHPNVCVVYEVGRTENGRHFIAMEYVEGETLRERLAREPIGLGEALDVARQVAEALAAAHRAGIVHRDIKPENVMLRADGYVKVLDFGVAKLLEPYVEAVANELVTPTGARVETESGVMGTVSYMSPEQARGEHVDGRSDIFSLGVMLYEMLAGERPFTGEKPADTLHAMLHESPPELSRKRRDVPPGLERVVQRCLEKDPQKRFPSGGELAETLGKLAEPTGVGLPALSLSPPAESKREQRELNPNNLPQPVTRFVGRGKQIAELAERLSVVRLLMLTGPGGIGKTRLALEVAAQVLDGYADGVWLVELAACADPALVLGAVAGALGVREEAGRTLAVTLADWLRGKQLLLVLDNCEHLVEACARLTADLLRGCQQLRVLATSREPLGIAGEAISPVPALTVPEAGREPSVEQLSEYEATKLFVERAALRKSGFAASERNAAAIVQLCRRLDGIPLAIELAAARMRALTVEQIVAKLDDRFDLLTGGSRTAPSRQQTLRATLDWSYALLEETEQVLFRRLSVFAGGWTLSAAEAVCAGAGIGRETVLDVLAHLVDRSLVLAAEQGQESRYRMLETVREYAREWLRGSGEADSVARRHAEFFLALAEASEPEMLGARGTEWIERLEAEHDNLRVALGWWFEHDAEACLRLAADVSRLWILHGYLMEGRRWLEAALERSDPASTAPRAKALRLTGTLALRQGDLAAARAHYEESLRIDRERGDGLQIGLSSQGLGAVAQMQGDLRTARGYLNESIAIGRAFGHHRSVADSLSLLGDVARLEGEWAQARRLYEEALTISRQAGGPGAVTVSTALGNLGTVACEEGDLQAARSYFRESLAIEQAFGNKEGIAYSLDGLGAVATGQGASARAARLAGAAEALRDAIGFRLNPADGDFRDRYLARVREALGEAGLEAALAEGRALTLEEAVAYALERESADR